MNKWRRSLEQERKIKINLDKIVIMTNYRDVQMEDIEPKKFYVIKI